MYYFTTVAIITAVCGLLWHLNRSRRDANLEIKARDVEIRQEYEKMLAPGEILLAVAPSQGQFHGALTDRRFIWNGNKERVEVPVSEIRKVVYQNVVGYRVKSPRDATFVLIKTKKKKYIVTAVSEDSYLFFEELWKMFPG